MPAAILMCLLATGEIPQLTSRPEAPITLLLDFDGHKEAVWGRYKNAEVNAFDLGNKQQTIAGIREIWERVSEDYIPFNVNVTTVEPADLSRTARVVIGGHSSAWYTYRATDGRAYGYQASGVAMQDGFVEGNNRVAWVFPDLFKKEWVKSMAESVAHESGHLFGVKHIPARDAQGHVTTTYNFGSKLKGPIMGIAFYTPRSLWTKALNELNEMQDDIQILTEALGQAPDDYANEAALALPIVHNPVEINGVIEHQDDVDLFHFRSNGGPVKLSLGHKMAGPNLKAVLELTTAKGEQLGKTETGKTLKVVVPPGTCYIAIKPLVEYGNLGRYWVSGTLPEESVPWTLLGH